MVLLKHSLKETYYGILSVQETASYEDIRASYRTLVLNYHPDKLRMTSEAADSTQLLGDRFLMIQKAWEVLSNSKSRRHYDNELRASRDTAGAEDVRLDDMMIEDAEEVLHLYYPCRCGDYFAVDAHELEEMGYPLSRDGSLIQLKLPDALPATFLISCGSCSLKICLVVESDSIVSAGNQVL